MSRPATLSDLADDLAGTFPARTDAPLGRALLLALARGGPVTDEQLATETRRPVEDVTIALGRRPNVHRDDGGAIVAFSGLSLRPTKHRFSVAGHELFTWCAWDTLFLPALLAEPADVRSACPLTGTHGPAHKHSHEPRARVSPATPARAPPQVEHFSVPESGALFGSC